MTGSFRVAGTNLSIVRVCYLTLPSSHWFSRSFLFCFRGKEGKEVRDEKIRKRKKRDRNKRSKKEKERTSLGGQIDASHKKSKTISMGAGTPQGSCLSPLLYIILVNDVPNVHSCANVGQFADDLVTWANAKTFSECLSKLQKAVNSIEGWCRRWRIKINGTKSNLIFFHRSHQQPTRDLALQMFNDIIRPTASAKYLGIHFDERLSFKPHFNEVEKKATSRLNVFKLLVKNGIENEILIRLYKIYVRPIFEYGSVAFLPANTKCLQQLQNEFIRLSLKLPRYIRTSLIHEAAGLEMVEKRLIDLNKGLMVKMQELEAVNDVMLRSSAIIPLNNYLTPLDRLQL